MNAQSAGNTGSLDHHVRWNSSLEFCCWQETVACIFDNWQSIFEDLPDTLNARHSSGRTPADWNQELEYSSEAAGWAAEHNLRGAKQSTPAGTPASHIWTKPQPWEQVVQSSLCRWQLPVLQTSFSIMACRLPRVKWPTSSRWAFQFLMRVSPAPNWKLYSFGQATPPPESQSM